MKKGSIKNNRINSEVLHELSIIIRDEIKDPDVDPLVNLTKVEVTPDLQFCSCHVSTLGSEEQLLRTVEGLERAKGYIRRELAHRVNLRKTPQLSFRPDRSMEYAIEMSKKIDLVMAQQRTADAVVEPGVQADPQKMQESARGAAAGISAEPSEECSAEPSAKRPEASLCMWGAGEENSRRQSEESDG